VQFIVELLLHLQVQLHPTGRKEGEKEGRAALWREEKVTAGIAACAKRHCHYESSCTQKEQRTTILLISSNVHYPHLGEDKYATQPKPLKPTF